MNAKRAGHGLSRNIEPVPSSRFRPVTMDHREATAKLGDVPNLAAALEVVALDMRAHEQTEAYWRAVWSVHALPGEP